MAIIMIPTPFRQFTDQETSFQGGAGTVLENLRALVEKYPALEGQLFDNEGNLLRFLNVFVGDEDIKSLQNEQTPVSDGTEISIIPAIVGGIFQPL